MNETIAEHTEEPQNWNHRLIGVDQLRGRQRETLEAFLKSEDKFELLGYTTYEHSTWAVRVSGKIQIWRIPFDPSGRWVEAKCRTWNKG